jgi:hypothetical protein
MRVLIVENSTIIAMHLAMLVTDLGHEVCARAARPQTRLRKPRHSNSMSP